MHGCGWGVVLSYLRDNQLEFPNFSQAQALCLDQTLLKPVPG